MPNQNEFYDVVIIGAGAAGLMTAITCARGGIRVLLLDGKEKIGAKILMSGGTRCNVTNVSVTEKDFESESKVSVRRVLRAFPAERAVEFFKGLGVDLVLEKGGKYFPATHSAKTVLDALIRETVRNGVTLKTGEKVRFVRKEDTGFLVSGDGFSYGASSVVVTTGGLSHPNTGSDGFGYELARAFGHTIIPTTAALTPFLTDDEDWKRLAGISVPCRLTLWVNRKKLVTFEDPLLFTHFGFSGPCALNISRHWLRLKEDHRVEVIADFLPFLKEDELHANFVLAGKEHPNCTVKRMLIRHLPDRFLDALMRKAALTSEITVNQFKRDDREKLARSLKRFAFPVKDVYGYEKAEVTAGGVDLKEVDVKTMESKLVRGLFFAGEILDADGRIGGFNFQWAWSTGFIAAQGVSRFRR
ncbi:MAG: NAD(P)/FAD-dependent oxidoreductase [Candidatus Omnitrophica bacterium]|nr:NAD(P)/FAD-dependent oxidoreductase [Candidatus Omnitrophota bacterium]